MACREAVSPSHGDRGSLHAVVDLGVQDVQEVGPGGDACCVIFLLIIEFFLVMIFGGRAPLKGRGENISVFGSGLGWVDDGDWQGDVVRRFRSGALRQIDGRSR
eukprot:2894740-Heterocapsa_arctica.AAC.1